MKDAEARTDGGEKVRGERRSELMEGKRDGVVESADLGRNVQMKRRERMNEA